MHNLTERDICRIHITPALQNAGWNLATQVREEVFLTDGRIIVSGNRRKRGERRFADYVLYFKPDIPVAVVEAKDDSHEVGDGIQQAIKYSHMLDVPFSFSSNGSGFWEHDPLQSAGVLERKIALDDFPSPEELWQKYLKYKSLELDSEQKIAAQDFYSGDASKKPRYYQNVAINRTVQAIAKGQNRILLTMATGTGKTYTAFQIAYRLWKAGVKKRILFLADRNVLIEQAKRGDFRYFQDKMTIIKKHTIDKSYEIYLALYQGLTNYDEDADAYKEFSPDFFDLVVVDECHRGSADADSAWREILQYFDSAAHIGLTATPRETRDISNIGYFGEPVYTYSLKQGIEDGFLAPYRVIRVNIDIDLDGWLPKLGQKDTRDEEIEQRLYNLVDYDRTLVIDERTLVVANRVAEYLRATDPMDKTIIFCQDINHAQRMRQALVNEMAEYVLENEKYVMKITGDDSVGRLELDNFLNPEEKYPVIATTSKLLTTGVDAITCKLIVLDSNINSMTEFKQIIGRGTRINEEFNKSDFTIMDFRNVTRLFADPDFDGEPVSVYEPQPEDPPEPTTEDEEIIDEEIDEEESQGRKKYYVNGVPVSIVNEQVRHLDKDGNLITMNLTDYAKQNIRSKYPSLEQFINTWNEVDKIQIIVDELEREGVFLDELYESTDKGYGPFDLICHIAFDQPPRTRKERAENVKKRNYFTKYGEQARKILETLLEKYADTGIENIESSQALEIEPLNQFGTPSEIVRMFGGVAQYKEAIRDLRTQLYAE
jgi:type I restriction enzyme R subunit